MFSKPRPVPSKAALKVLYQLAYISSGTAVGVATLCAEERRRRTHIVQKIADNAKRLRQSPRHVHNAAALAERNEEYGHGQQDQSYVNDVHEDPLRSRQRYSPLRDRSAHAPELPSFVERGYGQLVETDYKRTRRRSEGLQSEVTSRRELRPTQRHRPNKIERIKPEQRMPTYNAQSSMDRNGAQSTFGSRELLKTRVRSAMDDASPGAEPPLSPLPQGDDHGLAESHKDRDATKSTGGPQDAHRNGKSRPNVDIPPTSVKARSNGSPPVNFPPLQEEDNTVAGNSTDQGSLSVVREVDLSRRMQRRMLASGNLVERLQLIHLESSHDLWTQLDVKVICKRAGALADETDHEYLFHSYSRLLESAPFKHLPRADQIRCAVMVLAEAIHWDLGSSVGTRVTTLLGPVLQASEDFGSLGGALSDSCECLVAGDRANDASELIRACRRHYRRERRCFFSAEDKVLRALLGTGSLDRCARLLRPRLNEEYIEQYLTHVERFATACHQVRAYRTLIRTTELAFVKSSPGKPHFLSKLNVEAQTAIAIGFTTLQKIPSTFHVLYQNVPKQMRHAIDVARTKTRLFDLWKATHDLNQVLGAYESAKTFAATQHLGLDMFREMELTIIEICNSANRPDRALELLGQFSQNSSHSPHSLSIAAVALAKKKSWTQLDHFLGLLESSRALVSTSTVSKALNNVIHLYSRSHTATETWNFVSRMSKNLNFAPNKSTTTIMLQCFVSKQKLELIPRWLQHMRTLGFAIEMDGRIAADLIRYYYLEKRPPHVLLTDLCRDLIRMLPAFETERLENVVKESISYDLRTKTGQDTLQQRVKARTNMAILFNNGISTPAMREMHQSTHSVDPSYRSSNLSENTRDSHHFSESRQNIQVAEPFAQETAISEPSERGDTNDTAIMTSRNSDESAYGLGAHRKEAELAAEETMNALIHEFHADETDFSAGSEPPPVKASVRQPVRGLRSDASTDNSTADAHHDHAAEESNDVSGPTVQDLEHDETPEKLDYIHDQKSQQRLIRDMLENFSLQQYRRVIDLYHESLSEEGLPGSPKALEVTVEASLRSQRGNPQEARAIMSAAQDAGMNVACAMGPILLHQMWHSDIVDQRNANLLRVTTIDYYRINAEAGQPVSHHVGVTAANILVNKGLPEHGINILSSIYNSEWAQERDFDIAAMSVWLRGYAAMGSDKGLRWTLATVLKKSLRIDRKFLDTLKDARRLYAEAIKQSADGSTSNYLAPLRRWRTVFSQRREEQRVNAKLFGRTLVHAIVKSVQDSRQTRVDPVTMDDSLSIDAERDEEFNAARKRIARAIEKRKKAERSILIHRAQDSRSLRRPGWATRVKKREKYSGGGDATAELIAMSGYHGGS